MVLRKARRLIGKLIPALAPAARGARRSKRVTAYVFGLNYWKHEFIATCFPEYDMKFVRGGAVPGSVQRRLDQQKSVVFMIWGYKNDDALLEFAERHSIPLYRMEDGFVRSVGLGAAHVLPRSLVLDQSGRLYFDATGPTDLERICAQYDFAAHPEVLDEAKACLDLLMQERISKYNHVAANDAPEEVFEQLAPRQAGKLRVLVIGQVEDDASLKQGRASHLSNLLAVQAAVADHPEADVIFKPHPDDLGGYTKNRPKKSSLEEIGKIAKILTAPMSVPDTFGCIDRVYTITSLAGFEALLRGKTVTVLGYPFYAGWGLTDDRQSDPRRVRKLSLLELFAAAYLIYPKYFDPATGQPSTARETILAIARERAVLQPKN
jgi:capsule polysaccharide export protein KpsC/LpsZ